jgi:uncharacterized membrane protein YGL010W
VSQPFRQKIARSISASQISAGSNYNHQLKPISILEADTLKTHLKPKLTELFRQYAADHQHPMNRLTHKIAIPMIMFHIIAMLNWLSLGAINFGGISINVTAGHLFLIAVYSYYVSLNIRLTLWMMAISIPMSIIGMLTPGWAVVSIAILGWTIQLAGHYVWEKRSPSFYNNLVQTLIGPLFFMGILTGVVRKHRSDRPET